MLGPAAGAYCFQITITKTYNTVNLFEDLKALYKIAGVKGQPVAFIFTCAHTRSLSYSPRDQDLCLSASPQDAAMPVGTGRAFTGAE